MTIDSCYEGVIAKLSNQGKLLEISQKLLSLTTNAERVLYVYDLIQSLKAFPNILEVKKSETVSTYYRNQGNQCFKKCHNYEAWQYYNLALLHAIPGSENYGLALANRSAVLAVLKKYKECLNDIDTIFTLNYVNKLEEKLLKRQKLCKEALSKQSDHDEEDPGTTKVLTLQGSRHSRYVCASNKVEVLFNEEMGRHVIAKEDIDVGEIISQEEPYFKLLLKSQYLLSCSHCINRSANLIPCDSCCFCLYCSEECKKSAWTSYHSIECPLMAALIDLAFTKLELLALRTVTKARTDHTNWDGLFKTIEQAEANMNTEYHGLVEVDGQWIYDSKYYASIHTLASNIEKRSISDIFQKSVTAAVFLDLLTKKTSFLEDESVEKRERIRECVAGTLLLHVMTSPTNMHNIGSNACASDGTYTDEMDLASAPYAFLSLLNHSCSPNVVRFSKLGSGTMTLYALRHIKKGMQLFDNYGSHHAIEDRQSRQHSLKFQYKFNCLCEACMNDWPVYPALRPARNLPRKIKAQREDVLDSEAMSKLQKGDKDTALKLFKPLSELVQILEPYVPCKEMADCQEALKQCMIILTGIIPFGSNTLIKWNARPPKV